MWYDDEGEPRRTTSEIAFAEGFPTDWHATVDMRTRRDTAAGTGEIADIVRATLRDTRVDASCIVARGWLVCSSDTTGRGLVRFVRMVELLVYRLDQLRA